MLCFNQMTCVWWSCVFYQSNIKSYIFFFFFWTSAGFRLLSPILSLKMNLVAPSYYRSPPTPQSILPVGVYYRAACCDSLVFLIPSTHFAQQFWYSSISWTIFFDVQPSSNFRASNFQCCQSRGLFLKISFVLLLIFVCFSVSKFSSHCRILRLL